MRNKLLCIFSALTLMMSSVSGALAADINMSTKLVKVEGEVEGALKGTRYLAKVFNPGVKENTADYAVTEWYSYIYQDVLGAGGKYYFDYTLSENAGNGRYDIEIVTETGETVTDEFYYFTDEYADIKTQEVTTPEADTYDDRLAELMSDLEDVEIRKCLNADFELYDSLEDKSKAAAILLDMGTIDTRTEFKEEFAGISGAAAVSEAEAKEVPSILSKICADIGLENLSTYKRYVQGTDTVDSLLIHSGAETGAELTERLSYYVIKEMLSGLENWQLVQPEIAKYNDVLEIDFASYETSDYKYDIIEYFLSLPFEDVEGISSSFNNAMTEKAVPVGDDEPDNVTSNNKHESGKNSGKKGSSVTIGKGASAPVVTPVVPSAVILPDVADSHWAKAYITELVNKGVVSGDGNGNIRPDEDITREEFVKIMVAGLGIAEAESYVPFADVSENSWSSRYIQAARENQLITGTTDGRFMPGESITRQDLFVILGRYLEGTEELQNEAFGFADEAEAYDYAKPYIAHLARRGLVTGFSDGTVRPFEKCTRAEAFAMLSRVIELN